MSFVQFDGKEKTKNRQGGTEQQKEQGKGMGDHRKDDSHIKGQHRQDQQEYTTENQRPTQDLERFLTTLLRPGNKSDSKNIIGNQKDAKSI